MTTPKDWPFIVLLAVACLLSVAVAFLVMPIQAAPADGVVMCVKTATTGDIDFYYCEPNIGPSFVANSVGFIQIED